MSIRLAEASDVDSLAALYRAVYGDDYPFTCFYDTSWITRGVYDRTMRWFVVEDEGRLWGSGAVMLAAGDSDDQIAEIGRLVVHPDARGRSLGTTIVGSLTEVADSFSDFAFAECRTAHVGSQIIFDRAGYAVIGIEPLVYELGVHESTTLVCRLSDAARALRKPRPSVIPEAFELAAHALANCDITPDLAAVGEPAPYPAYRPGDGCEVGALDDQARYRLMKLGRGAALSPDVFGAVRLDHGHLKLEPYAARYLVLRREGVVVAGLGYTWDETDRKVKLFELVGSSDLAKGTMLERGVAWIEAEHDPRWLCIDVSAYSPAAQQSLHLMGFAPVAYAPSMVYSLGDRYDVLRMIKLRMPPKLRHWKLIEASRTAAELAERAVFEVQRGRASSDVLRRLPLFAALTDRQLAGVAAVSRQVRYQPGEVVFAPDSADQALFVVLEGAVDIVRGELDEPLARVEAGEAFGIAGLIEQIPQSAGAVCGDEARVLVIAPEDFDQLTRRDPEAGVEILRGLARQLSERLRDLGDSYALAKAPLSDS